MVKVLCFLTVTGDGFVTYGCQDVMCRTLGLQFDAFLRKPLELPLLPDDKTVDGHRVCTLVMEAASQCKFSFTNGNKMKLVVEDNECKRSGPLAVCSIKIWKCVFHQLNLVIVLIHMQYYCHTIEIGCVLLMYRLHALDLIYRAIFAQIECPPTSLSCIVSVYKCYTPDCVL